MILMILVVISVDDFYGDFENYFKDELDFGTHATQTTIAQL